MKEEHTHIPRDCRYGLDDECTLCPPKKCGALTPLGIALETVRKAGYKVEKVKNWYIAGKGQVVHNNQLKGTTEHIKARQAFLGSYATEEEARLVAEEIREKYGN
jgi:hypothetical protein